MRDSKKRYLRNYLIVFEILGYHWLFMFCLPSHQLVLSYSIWSRFQEGREVPSLGCFPCARSHLWWGHCHVKMQHHQQTAKAQELAGLSQSPSPPGAALQRSLLHLPTMASGFSLGQRSFKNEQAKQKEQGWPFWGCPEDPPRMSRALPWPWLRAHLLPLPAPGSSLLYFVSWSLLGT